MRINMKMSLIALAIAFAAVIPYADAANKPNIVLVFMDNFGYGEPGFNGGGIIRGRRTISYFRSIFCRTRNTTRCSNNILKTSNP